MSYIAPPTPLAKDDVERTREAGRRRSIIEGTWEPLAQSHTRKQLGAKRSAMVGAVDVSSNVAKLVVTQIARLYDEEPLVDHDDEAGLETMLQHFRRAKLWGLAQRNQRLTLMCNESVVFLGFRPGVRPGEKGWLSAEVVPSDFVFGVSDQQDPGQPALLYRAKQRDVLKGTDGATERLWCWDVWDVRPADIDAPEGDPARLRPSFRVLSQDGRKDLTAQFVDPAEWQGAAYPYRLEDGTPVVPAVLYHAEAHSALWAPWTNSEVVFGTLQDALNWTSVNHAFLRASWAQRYIAGGSIRGTVTKTANGEKVAVATEDPTTATQIKSDGDGPVSVGQWGAAVDIDKAERFARNYGLRLSIHFGLSPADVSFESWSPSSGAALTVSRAGRRELQKRYAPLFRDSDLLLLERAAAVLRAHGIDVPEAGYSIEYASVELSEAERKERLDNAARELEMGLTTKVAVVMSLNPGLSERQAKALLADVEKEIAAEKAARAPAPQPQAPPGSTAEPQPGADIQAGPPGAPYAAQAPASSASA